MPLCNAPNCAKDLWDTDKPASTINGTVYEELLFRERILDILNSHDPSTPLFITYTPKIAHYPLQAPVEYQQKFSFIEEPHRQVYAASALRPNLRACLEVAIATHFSPPSSFPTSPLSSGQLSRRPARQHHPGLQEQGHVGQHAHGSASGGRREQEGVWGRRKSQFFATRSQVLSTDNGGYVKAFDGDCEMNTPNGIACFNGEVGLGGTLVLAAHVDKPEYFCCNIRQAGASNYPHRGKHTLSLLSQRVLF